MSTVEQTQARHALAEAERLAAAGYQLTPVTIRRRDDGKKGATFHAQGGWRHESAWTTDPQQLRAWWVDHPDASFAVRTGTAAGVDVVDLDVKGDIDAVAWWAQQGHPLTAMVVNTPTGGMHLYARTDRLPTSAGVFAPGVDTRGDGGLVFAPGAYVVDEDGTYAVQGPLVPVDRLAPLPGDLAHAIRSATPAGAREYRADGQTVFKDRAVIIDKCRARVDALAALPPRTGGSTFRDAQMGAAMMLGRLVEAGAATHAWAVDELERATIAVWGSMSAADVDNITSGLADGPRKERWRFRPEATPLNRQSALADGGHEITVDALHGGTDERLREALGEDGFEELHRRKVAERVRSLRAEREARDQLAAENRAPLSIMDVDAFLDAPPPDYLVPKMLYRDGLAVVFGAPGAAKSFLVLDIALCLSTGTPWRGRPIGRGKVHYVMAEGQATNTLRTLAWLHHRDVDRAELRGWFTPITEPVMLTDAGIVDYVLAVAADQPDMIILDTKNLMFAGKESQGDDYGAMLRVLHRLRAAAGGCAIVLIDHSGLTDDGRTRGSNAQKGGVETEVRVVDDNGIRRAEITRDKSGKVGATWHYRLHQVDEVPHPADVEAPAVCVEVDATDLLTGGAFAGTVEDWNTASQAPLPDDVAAWDKAGRTAIKALARFMRYSASGGVGFTAPQATRAVRERYVDERGKPKWSADTVTRAWGALVELGRLQVAESGGSVSRSLWVARPGDPD